MHNYLLEYNDNFSLKNKIDEIIKNEKFQNIGISEYDLEEVNILDVLEDLDTYSLFSNKKILLVKNIQNFDIDSTGGKHLLKYLDNSNIDNLLIFISNNLDSRKKITKELKKKCNYIKLSIDANEIIKSILKEYKLESGAANLLIEWTNNNIDSIVSECEKLKLYKIDDKTITKEDIKKACLKMLGDPTNIIFDLVRYISSKNKKDSLITYKKLEDYGVDDMSIIGLLESQLRLLEQVNILYNEGKRKTEISQILDIHPFRIEKTIELNTYISKKDIDNFIINLADLDYKYKSGLDLAKRPLQLFILNI